MTLSRPDGVREAREFELLETLRWAPDTGFVLLQRHVDRLLDSARALGFTCQVAPVQDALQQAVARSDSPLRVRLLVSVEGTIRVESAPLQESSGPLRASLASVPIDPTDPFLYHKTTNRLQLDRERSSAFDDVILWNPAREITESNIANIVVDLGKRLVTPPVECGLLAGTLRADLLARGEMSEGKISIEELRAAPRFFLINSVRGWRQAVLA